MEDWNCDSESPTKMSISTKISADSQILEASWNSSQLQQSYRSLFTSASISGVTDDAGWENDLDLNFNSISLTEYSSTNSTLSAKAGIGPFDGATEDWDAELGVESTPIVVNKQMRLRLFSSIVTTSIDVSPSPSIVHDTSNGIPDKVMMPQRSISNTSTRSCTNIAPVTNVMDHLGVCPDKTQMIALLNEISSSAFDALQEKPCHRQKEKKFGNTELLRSSRCRHSGSTNSLDSDDGVSILPLNGDLPRKNINELQDSFKNMIYLRKMYVELSAASTVKAKAAFKLALLAWHFEGDLMEAAQLLRQCIHILHKKNIFFANENNNTTSNRLEAVRSKSPVQRRSRTASLCDLLSNSKEIELSRKEDMTELGKKALASYVEVILIGYGVTPITVNAMHVAFTWIRNPIHRTLFVRFALASAYADPGSLALRLCAACYVTLLEWSGDKREERHFMASSLVNVCIRLNDFTLAFNYLHGDDLLSARVHLAACSPHRVLNIIEKKEELKQSVEFAEALLLCDRPRDALVALDWPTASRWKRARYRSTQKHWELICRALVAVSRHSEASSFMKEVAGSFELSDRIGASIRLLHAQIVGPAGSNSDFVEDILSEAERIFMYVRDVVGLAEVNCLRARNALREPTASMLRNTSFEIPNISSIVNFALLESTRSWVSPLTVVHSYLNTAELHALNKDDLATSYFIEASRVYGELFGQAELLVPQQSWIAREAMVLVARLVQLFLILISRGLLSDGRSYVWLIDVLVKSRNCSTVTNDTNNNSDDVMKAWTQWCIIAFWRNQVATNRIPMCTARDACIVAMEIIRSVSCEKPSNNDVGRFIIVLDTTSVASLCWNSCFCDVKIVASVDEALNRLKEKLRMDEEQALPHVVDLFI